MHQVLLRSDDAYPKSLNELEDPPARLSVIGALGTAPCIAIVGTRRASTEACTFTRELAYALACEGFGIVSGGALGIDTAAHEGALIAQGRTIAVLGGGFDSLYPPENTRLFERIAERGALVTEAADAHVAEADDFLSRNRIIAALACLVIVVRAPRRSGALSTAAHAKRLGRPVFAVPGDPWDFASRGVLDLLARGASICTSVKDALSVAPLAGVQRPEPSLPLFENPNVFTQLDAMLADLSPESRAVMEALAPGHQHVDALIRTLGWPVSRLRACLAELELDGLVTEQWDGSFLRTTSPEKRHGQVPRHR